MEALFNYVGGYDAGEHYPGPERDGQIISVAPLPESEYDRREVGQMYRAAFPDGAVFDLFADEVASL